MLKKYLDQLKQFFNRLFNRPDPAPIPVEAPREEVPPAPTPAVGSSPVSPVPVVVETPAVNTESFPSLAAFMATAQASPFSIWLDGKQLHGGFGPELAYDTQPDGTIVRHGTGSIAPAPAPTPGPVPESQHVHRKPVDPTPEPENAPSGSVPGSHPRPHVEARPVDVQKALAIYDSLQDPLAKAAFVANVPAEVHNALRNRGMTGEEVNLKVLQAQQWQVRWIGAHDDGTGQAVAYDLDANGNVTSQHVLQ